MDKLKLASNMLPFNTLLWPTDHCSIQFYVNIFIEYIDKFQKHGKNRKKNYYLQEESIYFSILAREQKL